MNFKKLKMKFGIKKSEFKHKLSNTGFSGLDPYDGEEVSLSERIKDRVEDIKYLATPDESRKNAISSTEAFKNSIESIEALSLKEEEYRDLLEARDKANDNRGLRMSVDDLLAGKDVDLDEQPYSDKYQRYVEGFDNEEDFEDSTDEDDNIYRVNNSVLEEVLISADILSSPKSTRQEKFFGASCLVIGHGFCHLSNCQCSCHIEKVYRDKVPNPIVYAGYSVFRSLQQVRNEVSSPVFTKLLVDGSIFLMRFFDEYNVQYTDDQIEQGIELLRNMSENDMWRQNEFIELFS